MNGIPEIKFTPILIALVINIILLFITFILYGKNVKKDITHTASKLGLIVTIKSICLISMLIISINFFEIRNPEFGISFGLFLFLGILLEVFFLIRTSKRTKKT
jgi:tellurite resistance protein TehA-like permease